MSTSNPYRTAGLRYHAWGANVNAICQRNDLKAAAHPWKQYQTERQTRHEVERLPWGGYTSKASEQVTITGVAVINGIGDWRTLDLDKCPGHEPVANILERLHLPPDYAWVARTGSGNGWHIDVRCAEPIPPGVLTAKEKEKGVYLAPSLAGDFDHIELRWERCQTIKPPSQHYTGGVYRWHNSEPTEAPALVPIADLLTAWHAVAQKAPPAPPKAEAKPRRERDATEAAEHEAVKDRIRTAFDLVAYARANFPGEIEEIGDEVRVHDQGGLLIEPAHDRWYCHLASIGGDCFDLAGYRLHRERWDRTDAKMFIEALQEAARFTNVSLPDRRNGREREAHDEHLPDLPGYLEDGAEEMITAPAPTRPATKQKTARPVTEIIGELEALRPEGGEKPERTLVEAKALDLVADCAGLNRTDLQRIEVTLRTLGLPQEFARNWRAAVREAMRTASFTAGSETLLDGRPASWPYAAEDRRTWLLREAHLPDGTSRIERSLIADFSGLITEEAISESGDKHWTIQGETAAGLPFYIEIPAIEFADSKMLSAKLTQAAGPQAPVRAKMGLHLPAALQCLSRETPRQLRRFERTGWDDAGHFLIPGREPVGVRLVLLPTLPYQMTAEADLAKGLAALTNLIEAMGPERTMIILGALVIGPMAKLAAWHNERSALFVAGRTGTLKTSTLQTAMCLWGADFLRDDRLIRWGEGGSTNAIMGAATYAGDLPLLIDNYKPSLAGGAKGFTSLIHTIVEGSEKLRMKPNSEMRHQRLITTWPIFTGEDAPTGDAASIARVLVLPFDWPRGQANERLAQAQRQAEHLNAVGRSLLDWLEGDDCRTVIAQATAQFDDLRSRWSQRIVAANRDATNPLRVASNLTTNQLAIWILRHHPQIGPVIEPYAAQHAAGLEACAVTMAQRTAESLEATRFLHTLQELLATGELGLMPETGKDAAGNDYPRPGYQQHIGWRTENGSVYLLAQKALSEVLKRLGNDGLGSISLQAIFDQIAALGLLESQDTRNKRSTRVVRIASEHNKTFRVLHLKAAAIEPSEEQTDAE